MSDSVSAGGSSGSSGILSSTMRGIVRQAGDPQDRDIRRVEDVVDLSPMAAQNQKSERQVEPADPSDTLRNPGSQKNQQRVEREAEEAEAAAENAQQAQQAGFEVSRPVNMGMAAAINIGTDEMVRRFDTDGDERLNKVERERAMEAVQSEQGMKAGGGRMFRQTGGADSGADDGAGAAYLAEQEARQANAQQMQAEAEQKAERARAERIAALEEQDAKAEEMSAALQAQTRRPDAEAAYQKSDSLDAPPSRMPDIDA